MELDLLVIGSGPGGQRAAIQAAKLGKRVAVAERRNRLGGVSIHTGTIPSKTLRQATLEQLATRPLDVLDPTRVEDSERQAMDQLLDRAAAVVAAETAITREQFRRNHVGLLPGAASFTDDHTVEIEGTEEPIRAGRIVIAAGTRPARPATVEFDDRTIIDSDGLLKLESRVPRTMTVVGAGVIGVEYASMFGALGTKVTVVDQRDRVLVVPGYRDRRGLPVPAAPPQRDVPAAREGRRGRGAQGPRRAAAAGLRQGDRVRDGALRDRSPGRYGDPQRGAQPGSRPTSAGGSRSTRTTEPPCRTSSPSATARAAPGSRPPRWSRAGSRPCTPSTSRSRSCPS